MITGSIADYDQKENQNSQTTRAVLPNSVYFLENILSQYPTTVVPNVIWTVSFENLQKLWPAIEKALSYEKQSWNIEKIRTKFTQLIEPKFQDSQFQGCIFCQAISLPGEEFQVNAHPEANYYNNFLPYYIGAGRAILPLIRASFLETNFSFCEYVLRPWALATMTFGVRPKSSRLCRIEQMNVFRYSKLPSPSKSQSSSPERTQYIRQHWTFYNVACVSVQSEELNYNPEGVLQREATFVFTHYRLE